MGDVKEINYMEPVNKKKSRKVSFYFEKLESSGGSEVELSEDSILVIVCANNVGKSTFLRELSQNQKDGVTIKEAKIHFSDEYQRVIPWIKKNIPQESGSYKWLNFSYGASSLDPNWSNAYNKVRIINRLFISYTDNESKLRVSEEVEAIGPSSTPKNLVQALWHDDNSFQEVSDIVEDIFKKRVDIYSNGKVFSLRTSTGILSKHKKNLLRSDLRKLYENSSLLKSEGDGLRSFFGSMIPFFASPALVLSIDEPETFLHPPQANRLGAILPKISDGRQLIVSTHSIHLLKGLLSSGGDRVKIIRLTREHDGGEDVNKFNVINTAELLEIASNPIHKYSDSLESCFFETTIVCEDYHDANFFSAIAESVGHNIHSHHFISSGGKDRIHKIVPALCRMGIPVKIVVDFDVIRMSNPSKTECSLQKIVESIGKEWSKYKDDHENILDLIDEEGLAWDAIKEDGALAFSNGNRKKALKFIKKFRAIGIYIIEVGEVESLIRNDSNERIYIRRNKKMGNIFEEILHKYDLRSSKELKIARRYANMIFR